MVRIKLGKNIDLVVEKPKSDEEVDRISSGNYAIYKSQPLRFYKMSS